MNIRQPPSAGRSLAVDQPAARLELDLERAGEVALVRLAGRDLSGEEEVLTVGRQLSGLLEEGCRQLVVSLAGAAGVGTALIGKLIMLHNQAEAAGGRLALCGLHPQLHQALEAAGLTRLFDIYANEQEAALRLGVPGAQRGCPARP
jgi:anti-anti-sigma factor